MSPDTGHEIPEVYRLDPAALPRLGRLDRAPPLLEAAGDRTALAGPAVAIVGARAATRAALEFACELARRLSAEERVVISGGAIGVDAAAHEGALAAGGRTIAVLGTGIDVAYPERHGPLFGRIALRGLLVSPFARGTSARRSHFPARNPLVAALGDAVVIVEAAGRSGSLGTAAAARRMGLPLYARAGSPGCDALLARGQARLAGAAATLAAELLRGPAVERPSATADQPGILRALAVARDAEELAIELGLGLAATLDALLELELEERVVRLHGGRYLAIGA